MLKVFFIAFLGLSFSGVLLAKGDIAEGKKKAVVCAACHGVNGISATDIWPNLAGQKQGYVMKQLKAFKDGTRKDPSMSPMAAPLTDQDMENLAAYFASLSCK